MGQSDCSTWAGGSLQIIIGSTALPSKMWALVCAVPAHVGVAMTWFVPAQSALKEGLECFYPLCGSSNTSKAKATTWIPGFHPPPLSHCDWVNIPWHLCLPYKYSVSISKRAFHFHQAFRKVHGSDWDYFAPLIALKYFADSQLRLNLEGMCANVYKLVNMFC